MPQEVPSGSGRYSSALHSCGVPAPGGGRLPGEHLPVRLANEYVSCPRYLFTDPGIEHRAREWDRWPVGPGMIQSPSRLGDAHADG